MKIKHVKQNQAHALLWPRLQAQHCSQKQSQGITSSNMTSSTTFRAFTFHIESALGKKEERSSASTYLEIPTSSPADGRQTGRQAGGWTDRKPETDGTCVWMGRVIVSLDDLEVVQDGHDVLRHEDVAGVNGHAGHRDQQGVWGGDVKEELTEHRFIINNNNNNNNKGRKLVQTVNTIKTELWISFTSWCVLHQTLPTNWFTLWQAGTGDDVLLQGRFHWRLFVFCELSSVSRTFSVLICTQVMRLLRTTQAIVRVYMHCSNLVTANLFIQHMQVVTRQRMIMKFSCDFSLL